MNKYLQYFGPGELGYVEALLASVPKWRFSSKLNRRYLDRRMLDQINKAISSSEGRISSISDNNPQNQLRINKTYTGDTFVTTVVLSPLDAHVITAWNTPVGATKGRPPIDTTNVADYVQSKYLAAASRHEERTKE